MISLKPSAIAFIAAALLFAAFPLAAQDPIDEDDLFGDTEMIETIPEGKDNNVAGSLLVSDAVRIGGSFTGSVETTIGWNDPWAHGMNPQKADTRELNPEVSALLFFDARPKESSRFYGSVKTSWPFYTEQGITDSAGDTATLRLPDIKVFELFTDFNWNDKAYFRFGKQTVTWGVGYFFSPADVINLETIDPLDPALQREGPVTLRMNIPIPGSQHNIWAYGILDSQTMAPEDVAGALKGEFVVGAWELGIGAYYKYDNPFRGVFTASGSVKKVSLFGEATLSRGSDRKWASSIGATPEVVTMTEDKTSAFFKGTAGFMYSNSDWKMNFAGQYLFDGEGYSNADRKARIAEAHELNDSLGPGNDDLITGMLKLLIANSGRHYAALSVSRTELFVDDLSASLFAMANLSDMSAFVKPGLSYEVFSGLDATFTALFAFGATDSEYLILNDGPKVSFSFGLNFGSGSF